MGKALIIGGGISGLASALVLQRIGYDTVIYEQSPVLRNDGGGLTLWSNATNALKDLCVLEETYARSKKIRSSSLITPDGHTLTSIPVKKLAQKFGTETIGILRSVLYDILLKQMPDINIVLGARLLSLKETKDKVAASFENGMIDEGDILIGADGIHSAVRNQLITKQNLRFNGYQIWRGVVPFKREYCDLGYSFEAWGIGRRFGIIPVSDNEVCWFAIENDKGRSVDRKASLSKDDLLQLYDGFVEPIETIIKKTDTKEITLKKINDLKPIRQWSVGRVVLIGDAAHATTPNLGQGAGLALEDAVFLAKCLNNDVSTIEKNLRGFEKARKKRADFIVRSSYAYGKIAQIQNPFVCKVRNRIMQLSPTAEKLKPFRNIIGYKV